MARGACENPTKLASAARGLQRPAPARCEQQRRRSALTRAGRATPGVEGGGEGQFCRATSRLTPLATSSPAHLQQQLFLLPFRSVCARDCCGEQQLDPLRSSVTAPAPARRHRHCICVCICASRRSNAAHQRAGDCRAAACVGPLRRRGWAQRVPLVRLCRTHVCTQNAMSNFPACAPQPQRCAPRAGAAAQGRLRQRQVGCVLRAHAQPDAPCAVRVRRHAHTVANMLHVRAQARSSPRRSGYVASQPLLQLRTPGNYTRSPDACARARRRLRGAAQRVDVHCQDVQPPARRLHARQGLRRVRH
jgi:hypothetical protein